MKFTAILQYKKMVVMIKATLATTFFSFIMVGLFKSIIIIRKSVVVQLSKEAPFIIEEHHFV